MKRWRPPRPLILIALLLLAGAVVNIAVAWVLVGAPDSWTPGGARTVLDTRGYGKTPATEDQKTRVRAYIRAPESWTDIQIYRWRGLGWMFTGASAQSHGSRDRFDAGWPLHSLMFITKKPYRGHAQHSPSLEPPEPLLRAWGWRPERSFVDPRYRLPLTPIPIGFAINTLFYTAILALPLNFFPIRRRLRARRGRCRKCGYDLAGLADPAAPCPECGAAR